MPEKQLKQINSKNEMISHLEEIVANTSRDEDEPEFTKDSLTLGD